MLICFLLVTINLNQDEKMYKVLIISKDDQVPSETSEDSSTHLTESCNVAVQVKIIWLVNHFIYLN